MKRCDGCGADLEQNQDHDRGCSRAAEEDRDERERLTRRREDVLAGGRYLEPDERRAWEHFFGEPIDMDGRIGA